MSSVGGGNESVDGAVYEDDDADMGCIDVEGTERSFEGPSIRSRVTSSNA